MSATGTGSSLLPAQVDTSNPETAVDLLVTEDFDKASPKEEGVAKDIADTATVAVAVEEEPAASAVVVVAVEEESVGSKLEAEQPSSPESPVSPELDGKGDLLDTSGVALLPRERSANGQQKSKKKQKTAQKAGNSGSSKDSSILKNARMATSVEDITSLRLWKGIIAEFIGTFLLTLVGCGSCVDLNPLPSNVTDATLTGLAKPVPVVQIAFCFGLSVATIVWAIGHVSGGHINPAVTAAMLATRKISLVKGVFFVLFQLLGAVVGAGVLFGLTPDGYHGMLGTTMVNSKLSPGQGVGVELFITFVLVFVVFASCDGKRKDLRGSAPLTIGLSVTMCHLFAIEYTGSSMNTARSFGPALVMGEWEHHWVYWVGPIIGGMVAGIVYDNLFAVNSSLSKAKACILSSDYDDEKYKAQKIKVRVIEEIEAEEEEENDEIALTEKKDPSNA